MALPNARPVFRDAEFYNGNADSALTARRLIQWCRYTYYRHLRATPFDPGNAGLNFSTAGARLKGYSQIGTLGEGVSTLLGSFVATPSHGPHTHMHVRCYMALSDATANGFIRLTSARGVVYDLPVNAGVLGSNWGWITARVTAHAGEIFFVTGHLTSGSPFSIEQFTAWWDEAGFLNTPFGDSNYFFYGSGRADPVHCLRRFARMANTFAAFKAPIIANKWYGAWKNDAAEGMSILGQYRLHLSPRCSQVTMRFQARRVAGGGGGFRMDWSAHTAPLEGNYANITVDPGGGADPAKYQWYTVSFNVTPSDQPRDFDIMISHWGWDTGTRVRIATVQAWESGMSLPEVGYDPGYVDVDDSSIAFGSLLDPAHRGSLHKNLASAWFTRKRWLLDDCRWDEILAEGNSPSGTDNPDPLSTVWPNAMAPTNRGNASAVHQFQATFPAAGVGARVAYAMLEEPHGSASAPPPEYWLRAGGVLNTGATIPYKNIAPPGYAGGPAVCVDFGLLTSSTAPAELWIEQFLKVNGADQGNPDRFMLRSLGTSLYEVPSV